MGRPSKLDPERQKRFLDAIKAGNYIEVAATYAGLHRATVFRWLALGREAKSGAFRDFHDAVKAAEAEAEFAMVARVRLAATHPQNWTAAMTFLERRFRDRWARPPAGSVADGAPVLAESPAGAQAAPPPAMAPLPDRLAAILQTLDSAGKLRPDDAGSHNGHAPAESVSGTGGGSDGEGTV